MKVQVTQILHNLTEKLHHLLTATGVTAVQGTQVVLKPTNVGSYHKRWGLQLIIR